MSRRANRCASPDGARDGGAGLRPDHWVSVGFGRGNVLVVSPYLAGEWSRRRAGLDLRPTFEVIAIKSRVHFRRGFHDTGFARTILLVEPDRAVPGDGDGWTRWRIGMSIWRSTIRSGRQVSLSAAGNPSATHHAFWRRHVGIAVYRDPPNG